MNKLPRKFTDRVSANIKRYEKIALAQQKADVAEADTVTLVKDILADIFGYDKYEELTSEHQIKATFVDLAVKLGGTLRLLVEVENRAENYPWLTITCSRPSIMGLTKVFTGSF